MKFFSVVICTYNKAESIQAILTSLNALQGKELFEVQLIIDGATDNTLERVLAVEKDYEFYYHEIPNSGLTGARNFGIDQSNGNYIIFCDDDVIFNPSFMTTLHCSVQRHPDRVHIGDIINIDKKHTPKVLLDVFKNKLDYINLQDLKSDQVFFDGIKKLYHFEGQYKDFSPSVWWAVVTGGNLCIPKKYFKEIGYFDPTIQGWGPEDADLCYRFFKKGIKAVFNRYNYLYHLDHDRDHKKIMDTMLKNAIHFIKKHDKPKELYQYLNFTNGKISLKEFNKFCCDLFDMEDIVIPHYHLSMVDYSKQEQILKVNR
jgi:glycosyltransferase involved in cell wall biosynthesis